MKVEEIIGMRLEDAIKRFRAEAPDTLLHIGSRSAFFLIGTPEACAKLLDEISDECFKEFQRYVTETNDKLKYIPKKIKDLERRLNGNEITLVEFAQEFTRISGEEIKTMSYLRSGTKKVDMFIPMKKRNVTDCYVKEFEPGIAIIVGGDEVGKYWSVDEWNRRKTK